MGERSSKKTRPGPPPDLRVAELKGGSEQFLIMSYALPEWEFPAALTVTEREVMRAILRGATTQEVAAARGVSTRTIANQVASVFKRLNVSSRVELAAVLERARS